MAVETTKKLVVEPSAVIVGLGEDVFAICEEHLPHARLKIHRLFQSYAACERIAVLLPRLVVVPADMRSAELNPIEDCASAVGAVLLHLDATHDHELLAEQLRLTVEDLVEKFGRTTKRARSKRR